METLETSTIVTILNLKLPFLTLAESQIVIMSWIVSIILVLFSILATRKMKEIPEGLQNIFEAIIEGIDGLVEDMLGHNAKKFFPLIATLGLFILLSNLIGLIPQFKSPTSSLNATVPFALITFFTIHFSGIKERGLKKYIHHYAGDVLWMAPIMIPIHIIGELAKPVSLSVRLFGNIMGEDIVLAVLFLLVPLIIPIAMMCLAIFTSLIQSFIFMMLTMLYIGQFIEEE